MLPPGTSELERSCSVFGSETEILMYSEVESELELEGESGRCLVSELSKEWKMASA